MRRRARHREDRQQPTQRCARGLFDRVRKAPVEVLCSTAHRTPRRVRLRCTVAPRVRRAKDDPSTACCRCRCCPTHRTPSDTPDLAWAGCARDAAIDPCARWRRERRRCSARDRRRGCRVHAGPCRGRAGGRRRRDRRRPGLGRRRGRAPARTGKRGGERAAECAGRRAQRLAAGDRGPGLPGGAALGQRGVRAAGAGVDVQLCADAAGQPHGPPSLAARAGRRAAVDRHRRRHRLDGPLAQRRRGIDDRESARGGAEAAPGPRAPAPAGIGREPSTRCRRPPPNSSAPRTKAPAAARRRPAA